MSRYLRDFYLCYGGSSPWTAATRDVLRVVTPRPHPDDHYARYSAFLARQRDGGYAWVIWDHFDRRELLGVWPDEISATKALSALQRDYIRDRDLYDAYELSLKVLA